MLINLHKKIMHKFTVKDFPGLDLGDIRRDNRFVEIINNINDSPGSSIPQLNESWYDTKATYSFFNNEDITLDALKQGIAGFGSTQIEGSNKVLIAHDMSNISYNDLQAAGLGYLDNKTGRGIMCYSSIAIDLDGTPRALMHQHTWTRPLEDLGKAKKRKSTDFEDKETFEWKRGITEVNKTLGDEIEKIHVCDRGADIYDLFFCAFENNTDLLVRSIHNRGLSDGSHLWDAVSKQPVASTVTIEIPDKTGKKRVGIDVEVRYYHAEIMRPKANKSEYESVEINAIELKQISKLEEWQEESVHWKLLTTINVETVADALLCVKWYCYRWLIERFHYVLKSGTKIEELQLKQAESLQKAIHLYSIAAMRIMQMVYLSRVSPKVSCEIVLTKEQWIVLYMLIHKTKEVPKESPCINEAVRWISRLGGHLGRKQDGEPGLKTVWRGYKKLCDATELYDIMIMQKIWVRDSCF
jgi:hypothetical protein